MINKKFTLMGFLFILFIVIGLFADPIADLAVNNHDAAWLYTTILIKYCPDVCNNHNPPMFAEQENNDDGSVSNVCKIRRVSDTGLVSWAYGTNNSNNPNVCFTPGGNRMNYFCLCVDYSDDVDPQD
ncbi:MAG: hypothetical protein GY754_05475 [bacterium]|nr:hypothetical protein [bacterium]